MLWEIQSEPELSNICQETSSRNTMTLNRPEPLSNFIRFLKLNPDSCKINHLDTMEITYIIFDLAKIFEWPSFFRNGYIQGTQFLFSCSYFLNGRTSVDFLEIYKFPRKLRFFQATRISSLFYFICYIMRS